MDDTRTLPSKGGGGAPLPPFHFRGEGAATRKLRLWLNLFILDMRSNSGHLNSKGFGRDMFLTTRPTQKGLADFQR